jgi:predicted dehydrogenase
VYDDYRQMAEQEQGHLDVVAVVTPNDTHFDITKAFLE